MTEEEFKKSLKILAESGAANLNKLTKQFYNRVNELSIREQSIKEIKAGFKKAIEQLYNCQQQDLAKTEEEYTEAIKTAMRIAPKESDSEGYENTLRNIRLETFAAIMHDQDYCFTQSKETVDAYNTAINNALKKHENTVNTNRSTSNIHEKASKETNSTSNSDAVASLSLSRETNVSGSSDIFTGIDVTEDGALGIATIGVINDVFDNCG